MIIVHATARNVPDNIIKEQEQSTQITKSAGEDNTNIIIAAHDDEISNTKKPALKLKDKKCIVGGFVGVGAAAGVGAVIPLVGLPMGGGGGLGGTGGGAGGLGGLGGLGKLGGGAAAGGRLHHP
ncbi:POU domain, class 4, transcription factor 1-like [Impatiens glandulifera]|uniref:POU domain, class 4, transcription factor 1-like n=1 Tax=Impatiens glandulifera TaxID=253017 RepID=UPI001FB0BD8E|nr:POU domain, class 4, transcription factor 1-like [Impatiens glandulifera]